MMYMVMGGRQHGAGLVTCRILAVVNIMELDMDVNSDVVDHWLWSEMVRIEWLVGEESGNKVPDYFLDKGFLTGEEVEIWARDRVEDILDNLGHSSI